MLIIDDLSMKAITSSLLSSWFVSGVFNTKMYNLLIENKVMWRLKISLTNQMKSHNNPEF